MKGATAFLASNARWLGAGVSLTFLSGFGQTFFISVFAGEIRHEFGLSHGGWGALYSLGTLVSALVMIWAGSLTDRYRVRALGPVVLLGLALACLSMAFNSWVLLLPLVVFGLRLFGQGMSSHIAMVAMARWFQATRGRALAIAMLGYALGEALLPLIFVSAMATIEWKTLWLVCALICLAGIPFLMALLRQERTPQSIAASGTGGTGMQDRHWTRAQVLRHPLFWLVAPAILAVPAFTTAMFFHQVHLAQIKGWAHVMFVAMFPVYTGMSIAASLLAGFAVDRWGTARMMPYLLLPMAAGFVIFAYGSGVNALLAGFALLALTMGGYATVPSAFWAEFYGTAHIGAIKALATALMVLGSAIGPGVTGALIDAGIGIETQFLGFCLCLALASALVWTGIQRVRRR